MKKNKPLLHDPLITNRVREYLEENVDKTYLDISMMAKQLQERYPEYSRRKYSPFRALVQTAYRVVSKSYGMESQPTSDDSDDDLEVMDESPTNNIVGDMMNNLYSKSKASSKQAVDAEAIDISSDESADEGCTNGRSVLKVGTTPTIKTFRDVTLTKLGAGDSNSKSSSSLATEFAPIVTPAGQKRVEQSPLAGQPLKKRKSDNQPSGIGVNVVNYWKGTPEHPDKADNNVGVHHRHNQNIRNLRDISEESDSYSPYAAPQQQQQQLLKKRYHKYKKVVQLRNARETFRDIGGMEKILKELCELLLHIKSPDIYFILGLMPPRGILVHGPSGCGKTLLANAIAGQLNIPMIEIPATELIAGVSGESEQRIRDVFEQAIACAPCVLFIDEIDSVSSNRSLAQKDMERRVVSQLISSLDNLKLTQSGRSVLVLGATTRADLIDPALRRVGRFDHEIAIGIPNRKDRKDILTIICDGVAIEPKCDFDKIAELTPGYVGADLLALVSRAATIAVKRKSTQQMHAFQAKNLTIVNLDDEENNDEADKSPKGSEEELTKNSNDSDKLSDEKPVGVKDSEVQNDVEAKEPDATETESITPESMDVADENTIDAGVISPSELVEQDAADNDIANDSNEAAEPEISTNIPEPSLLELLNWLDNPPEDISLITEFSITLDDFLEAVKVVQPSAKREGFITVPNVSWDDVGSLRDIREELKLAVLAPVKFPEKVSHLGISVPSGVLLCGPPGCGKTLIAKAIANEAGINFISVKGPELINMYVGESERAVRACFQRARNSVPCVIFFDEFDSLCPKRSDSREGGSGTRVVNQLLTEMDGVEDRQGVYILAATNRPDIIDPAILRPGRLDTILYVGLPKVEDRVEILKATTKNGTRPVLNKDVDYTELAEKTNGYTGADLAGLVRQASMLALKESLVHTDSPLSDLCVSKRHFLQAIQLVRPSISAKDHEVYEKIRLKYAAPRGPSEEGNN